MDTTHKDVYEAAHSVVLSIFSAPPLMKTSSTSVSVEMDQSIMDADRAVFVRQLIPGYVDCLINVRVCLENYSMKL